MSSLFSTPKIPAVAAAAPMPDANSAAVREAARLQTVAAMGRAGRASTIMGRQGQNGPSQAPTAVSAAPSYTGSSLGTAN